MITAMKQIYKQACSRAILTTLIIPSFLLSLICQNVAEAGVMIVSDTNPNLAVNAYGGAQDGTILKLVNNCTPNNPDCTWTFRNGMLFSDADPNLAVNAYGGAQDGTVLKLVKNCPPNNSDCTWTYSKGMLLSDTNPSLAVNAYGGAAHGTELKLVNNCPPDNPDCTWTFRNLMIFSDTNPELAMNAYGGATHGTELKLVKNCPSNNPDCTWTLHKGMLFSDTQPDLAMNAYGGATHGTVLKLVNKCPPDNTDCTWTLHKGMLFSDTKPDLAMNAYGGAAHGTVLKLVNKCPPDNPDCTWTIKKDLGNVTQTPNLEIDTNRMGMDYRRIELPAADPVLCQNECVGDSGCKSFTYVKPGLHAQGAICYLKNGEPNPTPNNCCTSGLRPSVTQAQAESILYQAYQAWQTRIQPRRSINGQHDTLSEYAKKCDIATGIHVPAFNCDAGTKVPGQGNIPATRRDDTHCDQPNVLNGVCDPGSKFQVLPGGTSDAVAVAHCRKNGLPIVGSEYNDIAVIQYNKKNGAVCFYQALSNLPGQNVPAPLLIGEKPWQPLNPAAWKSPEGTEVLGCTGCHDNGGFIRSEYLAQLKIPPNVLPNESSGFNNLNTPVKYVGLDYADNRSWSILVANADGDIGDKCTKCHRLAVNNFQPVANGTAANFAQLATANEQDSKNPHSSTSPIWMRPDEITYKEPAEKTAIKFHDCAVGFFNSNFTKAPAGCSITPLGDSWIQAPPPHDKPIACSVFNDGSSNISPLSEAIYFADSETACTPDGAQGLCRRWFGNCISITDNVAVTFKVFNDGNSSTTSSSGAVYNKAPNVACIPDGTSTGNCRRWFGMPTTADGRKAECYLFDDGLTNWIGPTEAMYYSAPGQVCMPDGSASGACRKWFGNCQVTNQRVPPPSPRPPTPSYKEQCLKACNTGLDKCMAEVATPGASRPPQCVKAYRDCKATCTL